MEAVPAMPKPRLGRRPLYPWELWTNGQTWRITFAEDYFISTKNMRMQLYGHARSHGLLVEASVPQGHSAIVFRFWKEWQDGDEEEPNGGEA